MHEDQPALQDGGPRWSLLDGSPRGHNAGKILNAFVPPHAAPASKQVLEPTRAVTHWLAREIWPRQLEFSAAG
jgi:hypothetical protein